MLVAIEISSSRLLKNFLLGKFVVDGLEVLDGTAQTYRCVGGYRGN